jgi:pimeloyl-ACP methyl ester carboxylesterase
MFIAGAHDDVLKFPSSKLQVENFSRTLPDLRGCHILEGAGHWIQRERAQAVNALLIDFLNGL